MPVRRLHNVFIRTKVKMWQRDILDKTDGVIQGRSFFLESAHDPESVAKKIQHFLNIHNRSSKTEYLLGESFCQNPIEPWEDERPNASSADGSVNSPRPGFLMAPACVLHSASDGEEWTDAEVAVTSASSGRCSVWFRGPRLAGEDWITLGSSLGTVVAAWILFVWLAKALRRAVGLLGPSTIPDAKTEEGMLKTNQRG